MANWSGRHWLALGIRAAWLLARPAQPTAELVRRSYDHVAPGYDDAWTNHMRPLSVAMLDELDPPRGARCLDLCCGTGFVTGELARRTGDRVIGVDASGGMLAEARANHPACDFRQGDAAEVIAHLPAASFDVITCAWALGYSRPWRVVRESARVLTPGGKLAIIDNSLTSLAEVLTAAMFTFAETPDALHHAMSVRFLPRSCVLAGLMRLAGLGVCSRRDGAKTYHVPTGSDAIDRLTATGAAAGFEFAPSADRHEAVFKRFAEIIEQRCMGPRGVPIVHRYLQCIGRKR